MNIQTFFFPTRESSNIEQHNPGKTYLTVLNASNEVLVEKFLKDQIGFYDIPYYIEKSLDAHNSIINPKLDDILEVDRWARSYINDLLK